MSLKKTISILSIVLFTILITCASVNAKAGPMDWPESHNHNHYIFENGHMFWRDGPNNWMFDGHGWWDNKDKLRWDGYYWWNQKGQRWDMSTRQWF